MRKLMLILTMMLTLSVCSSCVATHAAVQEDVYVTNVDYYNDALYVGYEIVWVNNWPYWFLNDVFVPYHHNHVLPKHHHYPIERRVYRPTLKDNRYHPRNDRGNYWRRNYDRHRPPVVDPHRNGDNIRPHQPNNRRPDVQPQRPNQPNRPQQTRPNTPPRSQSSSVNRGGGHFSGGHSNTSRGGRR